MSSELLFSRCGGRTTSALREDGVAVELRVEGDGAALTAGRIVKARVSKVLPGIQSAFLDVGQERGAFLHVADLLLPGETPPTDADERSLDETLEDPDTGGIAPPRPRRDAASHPPIEDRLKVGRELLVQVAREGIGAKGPRVSCFVGLPGRFLVHTPLNPFRGVSRRIEDQDERQRLRQVVDALPGGGGFIVRTAGAGAAASAFEADARRLVTTWAEIVERARTAPAPTIVHRDVDLFLRTLRDASLTTLDRIVVDDPGLLREGQEYLAGVDPALASRLTLHAGRDPLFEATGVAQEIEKALRPRVWLRSGGTLVIEQTEALVSIDVNTGKYVGSRRPEETVLRTNLEAADEIARQLRLRDLGGIIVVDFIDMARPEHRREVIAALERALRRDRARTKVVGLSELGLLQLTRKRTRPGVGAILTHACPTCAGSGRVKTPETVAQEAIDELRRVAATAEDGPITVKAHPDVARAVRWAVQTAGESLGREVVARLVVSDDVEARPDGFDVSVL